MVKHYRTREGEATAVDTRPALTTQGSVSAPGPLLVPSGVRQMAGVIVSCAADGVALGSGAALIRIEGGGLPEGPETLTAGAFASEKTAGVNLYQKATYIPLGIKVTSGNEILLYGEMVSGDIGSIHFTVTVVFE